MKCVEYFSCYKHFCRSDLRPNQPYHQFPEYGMSGTPDCADVGPKLWFNLCQWSQKTAFHPWPKVFGLNTTNTTCFVPTCKHVHWWSQLSLPDASRVAVAVALWMYSCVQGKLRVAPWWDLTKHLLQMWRWLHKQLYRQMTFTKTSELSKCYYAEQ